MRSEIRHLQKTLGITVLYVTHDQEEALAMSDRIAVMRSGRVEQVGDPRAIYEQPATAFVASFVGSTNLLDGSIERRDGEIVEVKVAGTSLRARAARGEAGDRVVLSIRPEGLRVLTLANAAPPGWATLSGRVDDVEYLGAITRCVMRLADGTPLHLMALAPPAGEQVTIAYDPARVVVLEGAA
jgi:ABC-type Fe3+/spermidine/putrescine transport system ATPase subunit